MIMRHFIRFSTVCEYKIDLQRKKYNIFSKIITCDTIDLTIVCGFMENSVGFKGVKTILQLVWSALIVSMIHVIRKLLSLRFSHAKVNTLLKIFKGTPDNFP